MGLIPARAGSTPGVDEAVFEHEGSSPLARGARAGPVPVTTKKGLIPARAGSTANSFLDSKLLGGSSPLARGAHLLTWGFTPYTSKIESL